MFAVQSIYCIKPCIKKDYKWVVIFWPNSQASLLFISLHLIERKEEKNPTPIATKNPSLSSVESSNLWHND